MTREEFRKLIEKKPVLLDGATGSNMFRLGMPKNVCTEAWILDHAQLLISLQKQYAAAGSRIIYAPTFSANRISLKKFGREKEVDRINRGLTELTRQAAGKDVFVAGDITTTGEVLEPIGELEEEDLLDAYKEQAVSLAEAGADLIVAETLMSIQEAEIALKAVREVCSLPFMATMTVQADGRSFFGGTAEECVRKMQDEGADAAGINCSVGPDQLMDVVSGMRTAADLPLVVKPNAGIPHIGTSGYAEYSMGAEEFAERMKVLVHIGADLIGGCCGTDPEYIRKIKEKIIDTKEKN